MPSMGECRSPFGCSAVHPSIWARISGDALSRNHALPSSEETATHSCVRASTRMDPSRAPRQFLQAQFHCGQPPPAAEPSTWILTGVLPGPGNGPEHSDYFVGASALYDFASASILISTKAG